MEATPLPQNMQPQAQNQIPRSQAPAPQMPPAPEPGIPPVGGQKPSSLRRDSMRFRTPRVSAVWVFLFVVALMVFLVAYFVFTKPNTGPASLIFSKIFPPESGLIKLQAVDLDILGVVEHPVFSRLREKGPLPIQIPPLGKPNPFL
jgi:hypothetical protein